MNRAMDFAPPKDTRKAERLERWRKLRAEASAAHRAAARYTLDATLRYADALRSHAAGFISDADLEPLFQAALHAPVEAGRLREHADALQKIADRHAPRSRRGSSAPRG